jgi:hypothetical protein
MEDAPVIEILLSSQAFILAVVYEFDDGSIGAYLQQAPVM